MRAAGREVEITSGGRRTRAFIPTTLARRRLELDLITATRAGAAASEIEHAAETLDPKIEPLARLLLRAEGVASSYVEGVTAPVADVLLAEFHLTGDSAGAAAWIASNLTAIDVAIKAAKSEADLSVESLCHWHRALMTGNPAPDRHVGVIRSEQGWIGGTSPLDAHLVTPPPAELPDLLTDLVAYSNRTDIDPIAQAAVAHAQFELIHPFADGNGRVGRVLVAWVLTRRLALLVPPPVSVAVAADVGGYMSGLVLFRMGDHNAWIRWFCDAVTTGGRAQRALAAGVDDALTWWRARLSRPENRFRKDAAVHRAIEILPRHVVLTSTVLAEELGISQKASIDTLQRLAGCGILSLYGSANERGGRPLRVFVANDLLRLIGTRPLRTS